MPNRKRAYRWLLFVAALLCFFYVVFVDHAWPGVICFFLFGGAWYFLEQRKTRELDAPAPK